MTKVLLCLDNHKVTQAAFDWYFNKLHQAAHQIKILHFTQPSGMSFIPMGMAGTEHPKIKGAGNVESVAEETSKNDKLKKIAKKYQGLKNIPDENYEIEFRELAAQTNKNAVIGKEIILEAVNNDFNFVVMGCRSMNKKKKFMGSVSDSAMKGMPEEIPVMLYKIEGFKK